MRFLLNILLFFIPFLTLAQDMVVESFRRLDTDMDARINYPEQDYSGRTCAIIKVVNPNTGFVFDTGTVAVVKTRQGTGEIWVYVQPGVKKFIINHPTLGVMRDYYFPMAIEPATVYELRLTTGTIHTYVEQKSTTAYLVVTSVPEGADVYIAGEWVGTTPFNKKYNQGESLQYRISHPLYHDVLGVVNLNKTKVEENVVMKPACGSISVTSQPAGASVMLDNESQARGITPLTITEVPSGKHRVRVKMPRYGQKIIDVTVTDGKTVSANALLNASFANVTVNSLQGATIKADGAVKGTGSATWEQEPGICEIEVTLAGHRKKTQKINVEVGKPQTLTLEPVPMYGILSVESEPMGADIYIDGIKRGVTPDVIDKLLATDHTIKLSKAGHGNFTTIVTVKEGEEQTIHGVLSNQTSANASLPSSTADNLNNSREFTVNGVAFKMMFVEGGSFVMGATGILTKDAGKDEKPTHNVTLSDFLIGETEVTQELWSAVMKSNPSSMKGDSLPVESVGWNDCQNFIKKLNSLTGQNFRLPTEAEWEYATKGGNKSHGYLYSGSHEVDSVVWYAKNCSPKRVATKKANELGIYDMSGNVWEWCSDWYGNYTSTSQINPTGPMFGSNRVLRGGSWYYFEDDCRVSKRRRHSPNRPKADVGFRLALSL